MELLNLRQKLKSKKPTFIRQKAHGLKKLEKVWRAPKGIHSKLRKKKKGHMKHPSVGFSSPREVRGFSPSGLKPILVINIKQLDKIKNEGIVISSLVGNKKRIELLKKIKERNLVVLNIKNVDDYIKKIEDNLQSRKQKKKEKTRKTVEEKSKKEVKEETIEERKEREKEEKRKVLESKK